MTNCARLDAYDIPALDERGPYQSVMKERRKKSGALAIEAKPEDALKVLTGPLDADTLQTATHPDP
eukprot:5968066-Prorocentrum_lima.AAC.1